MAETHTAPHLIGDDAGQSKPASERLAKYHAQLLHSEKMAAIGQLAAGVAHEINNPTGFIGSNLKTLQSYQSKMMELIGCYRDVVGMLRESSCFARLEPDIKNALIHLETFKKANDIEFLMEDSIDLVKDCSEGAMRIKKIVSDLKALAHPGDDRVRMMDVNKGLASTLNVVQKELKYKAVVRQEFGKIPIIWGYPQELNQVFMNILINAAQAIEGRGHILVRTRVADDQVEVMIQDDGSGVDPENIPRLFEPFFTTKAVGKGTGLGLHIAYDIVKKHRGTIEVQSELGKGTAFTVRLPVSTEDHGDAVC